MVILTIVNRKEEERKFTDMIMDEIKRSAAIKLLLKIHEYEKKKQEKRTISGFMDEMGIRAETYYKYKKAFIELGLIEEVKEETFPFRSYLKLTNKGKKIIEKIQEIEKILEDSP